MIEFFKQKNKKESGFTLVETLVAISIFSVSIIALMAVLASGVSDINYAKRKITATYLAQEGIEYVRKMRDNVLLSNDPNGWVQFKTAFTSPSNCPNVVSGFPCQIQVQDPAPAGTLQENNNGNEVKVVSTVSWQQGSGTKSVSLSESLFNWLE